MRVMQFKLRAETPDSAALHPGYIGAHVPYENLRVVFVACSLICESRKLSVHLTFVIGTNARE